MTPASIIEIVTAELEGVVPKSSWGETSLLTHFFITLFYNPGLKLPNGVYFCTIKENDGDNDKSSNLARDSIYRLSIGLPKGGIVDTGHDFTKTNILMPHPIYA